MACNCLAYECIKVFVSPCDTGVSTGLVAPVTGDYEVRIGFNEAWRILTLALVEDDVLILPNVVNGNYIHEMEVILPDGEMLGDTCYWLDVQAVVTSGNGLTPTPESNPYSRVITLTEDMLNVDGSTITNSFFGGKVINEIDTENQAYLVGAAFTQSGNVITWINGNLMYVGQVIKISW